MQYVSNSPDVNWVPLSDTIVSGYPNLAKIDSNILMVFVEVIVAAFTTTGHLNKASTTIKK